MKQRRNQFTRIGPWHFLTSKYNWKMSLKNPSLKVPSSAQKSWACLAFLLANWLWKSSREYKILLDHFQSLAKQKVDAQ